jgi:hypothetical protein
MIERKKVVLPEGLDWVFNDEQIEVVDIKSEFSSFFNKKILKINYKYKNIEGAEFLYFDQPFVSQRTSDGKITEGRSKEVYSLWVENNEYISEDRTNIPYNRMFENEQNVKDMKKFLMKKIKNDKRFKHMRLEILMNYE